MTNTACLRAFLCSVAVSASACLAAAAERPPNIIIIYADDLGYGDVGAYGATALETPEMDRLAREGMRFTSAYSTSATCTPSRYSMLTGEYAWRGDGRGVAPADAPLLIPPGSTTLGSILQEAGYYTAIVGKWHLGLGTGNLDWNGKIAPGPLEVGFDSSFIIPATVDRVPTVYIEGHYIYGKDEDDEPLRVSYRQRIDSSPSGQEARDTLKMDWSHGHNQSIANGISRIGWQTGAESAHWRDEDIADVLSSRAVEVIENNKDRPFFLYFSLHDPHVPRVPHERFVGATDMGPRGDVIVQIDWCVGEINRTLDRLGLTENTIVILTSDNGPVLDDGYKDESAERIGDHKPAGPFRGWKYSRFEGGTRMPTIIRWPARVPAGTVSDSIISQVDFPATFAALTGRELQENEAPDSFNFLPVLVNPEATVREHVVQQGIRNLLGFRRGDWKYHHPSNANTTAWETGIDLGSRPYPQLYNLAEDLGETNNLAEEHPELVEELHAELEALRAAGRSRP